MASKIISDKTKDQFMNELLNDFAPMFTSSGIDFSTDSKAKKRLREEFAPIVDEYYKFTDKTELSTDYNRGTSSSYLPPTSPDWINPYPAALFEYLEVPPPQRERYLNTWAHSSVLSDPLWDINVLPLTYSDSRRYAFILRVDEATRQRLVPNPPLTVWDGEDADLVEYWYVDHKNTMLGPYHESGVTISATYKDPKGNVWKAGYYPYIYITGDATVDTGRVLEFPKKMSYIRITTHGGEKGTDFFGFAMSRNGYLLHSATGQFDDKPVKPPYFYGKTDWGRFNMKVVTRPDLSSSQWQLTYIASELPEAFNIKGHRFQIKPEHTRTASGDAINWFHQTKPSDNMGAELKIQEVTGLISVVFDLIIPPAAVLWTETYERPASYRGYATPYKYGLRQLFPKSVES